MCNATEVHFGSGRTVFIWIYSNYRLFLQLQFEGWNRYCVGFMNKEKKNMMGETCKRYLLLYVHPDILINTHFFLSLNFPWIFSEIAVLASSCWLSFTAWWTSVNSAVFQTTWPWFNISLVFLFSVVRYDFYL